MPGRAGPGVWSHFSSFHFADSDECAREEACAQQCRNTPGSFECACADGYALRADRRSCAAADGRWAGRGGAGAGRGGGLHAQCACRLGGAAVAGGGDDGRGAARVALRARARG